MNIREEYINDFIKMLDEQDVPQEDRHVIVWCSTCGSTLDTRNGETYDQCCLDTIRDVRRMLNHE